MRVGDRRATTVICCDLEGWATFPDRGEITIGTKRLMLVTKGVPGELYVRRWYWTDTFMRGVSRFWAWMRR